MKNKENKENTENLIFFFLKNIESIKFLKQKQFLETSKIVFFVFPKTVFKNSFKKQKQHKYDLYTCVKPDFQLGKLWINEVISESF